MPLRILIAPDKFKGSLPAHDAAAAIAEGWRKARPRDRIEVLPMTDGGDGFGAVLGELTKARPQRAHAVDAAHRRLRALWWSGKDGTAIIDSAGIIGLAMLPLGRFHPFGLDSFGLGMVMRAAADAGAKRAIIGIGGSATNDGGFGMARALGWRFLDKHGTELTEWWQLHELANAQPPARALTWRITVAVDVANPLLGPKGATRVYGPQKGLRPVDFPFAERCFRRLGTVMKEQHGIRCAKKPGAGAAGGLGFGLMAFAGAEMKSGFEIYARCARLDERIRRADLVITGEGRIDRQTYMGKGVGQIAQRCRKFGVPCVAMTGIILEPERARAMFSHARALVEIARLSAAKKRTAHHLRALSAEMAAAFEK